VRVLCGVAQRPVRNDASVAVRGHASVFYAFASRTPAHPCSTGCRSAFSGMARSGDGIDMSSAISAGFDRHTRKDTPRASRNEDAASTGDTDAAATRAPDT
jgi:hypothetical protein